MLDVSSQGPVQVIGLLVVHLDQGHTHASSSLARSTGCVTHRAVCLQDEMEILHNRAVDYQLQQLYHALGLALALNRTLLMPEMLCFCARGWYPNDVCRLAGDYRTQLPFRCTGDQVGIICCSLMGLCLLLRVMLGP